ncbi:MAG TPA: hypothetical protein VHA06_00405, partial [Candidatus Angelobacter sp.]|nr:hypothetical protein [Candidatus Angelobacter sp.]
LCIDSIFLNKAIPWENRIRKAGKDDVSSRILFLISQPSHRIWKKAGMFCVALPHGRDEKVQQQHSSRRKTELTAADLQLHS